MSAGLPQCRLTYRRNGPLDQFRAEASRSNPLCYLSVGPETGRLRLEPTPYCRYAMMRAIDGFPFLFMYNPPWHPFDLLLTNRGIGGRLPDRKPAPEPSWEGYCDEVAATMGWHWASARVLYHVLTPFHANGVIQEDACATLRASLYESFGFDPAEAARALRLAREQVTYPDFRVSFWGKDVYGEITV